MLKFGGTGDDSDSDGDQALLLAGIQPGTATDPAQAHKNKNSKRKPPFNKKEADYTCTRPRSRPNPWPRRV